MSKTSYAEKLKDKRWQQKRLELLEAAKWKCQHDHCQTPDKEQTLSVHHAVYFRNTEPWDYPEYAYRVYCEDCHVREQNMMERAHALLAKFPDLQLALLQFEEMSDAEVQTLVYALFFGGFNFQPQNMQSTLSLLGSLSDELMTQRQIAFKDGIEHARSQTK